MPTVLAAATEAACAVMQRVCLAEQEAVTWANYSHGFAAWSISRKETARLSPSQPSHPPSTPSVISSCSGLSWVYLLLALPASPRKA